MSTEARTVRPFVSFGGVAGFFDDAVFHFGDQSCNAGSWSVFSGDENAFRASSAAIDWAPADRFEVARASLERGVEELGYSPRDVQIVVVASSSYLKIADVVFSLPLDRLAELSRRSKLTDGTRSRAFNAVHHGFTVDPYIVLDRNFPPRPLYPHRRGTWLATTRFRVATESVTSLFRPTPLTNELRRGLELGSKVTRFVSLDVHDPLKPFDEQVQPTLYVDEEILAQMNATARTSSSKAMQLQLVLDFVQSVVAEASRHTEIDDLTYQDVEGSLVYRLIEASAPKDAGKEKEVVFRRLRSDPDWVIAYVEHALDLRKAMLASLEGDGE